MISVMPNAKVAPYGSWDSPFTADLIVRDTIALGELGAEGRAIYWTEGRPTEDGRNVLMRWVPDGEAEELTPAPYNVRTRVHEYGGGAFWVHHETVYFVHFDDQRLYRLSPGSAPRPLTPSNVSLRYADGIVDERRGRIICVREDHTVAGGEPLNTLVSISLSGDAEGGQTLVMGNDFYASPRLSADGMRLVWLSWDHPNMPWDGTELWLAELDDRGRVVEKTLVAGGKDESIFQPQWSSDGDLYFVSDRTGWWNLYRWRAGTVEALYPQEAEFGLPQWLFNTNTYGITASSTLVVLYHDQDRWHMGLLEPDSRTFTPIITPYTHLSNVRIGDGFLVVKAASPSELPALVRIDLKSQQIDVLRRAGKLPVDMAYLSLPEVIQFPSEGGEAYANFYPPQNPNFIGPTDEKPPLLVVSHGGPTGHSPATLNLDFQYWTSRGIAVLDVNYRGSTGYGRPYREALYGRWGEVDVMDCINGARYLVRQGRVDGNRLAIRGGSAGGYTTLSALTFHDEFHAGASYFGVSDLERLASDTHKFESRYLDNLVGPYPEQKALYEKRSPVRFAGQLSSPVIFLQGLEDVVVPPSQAEIMVDVLREKGLPVTYLTFAGEQHGFRRAENIKRALEAELYFYSRIFDFKPADALEPVEIENL